MVGWYHLLSGYELEQSLGVGDGQVGLVCCDSWGPKELDTTERRHFHFHRNSECSPENQEKLDIIHNNSISTSVTSNQFPL